MFQGKIIVITGSAQGLGKAFARRLLAGGARVCISDIQDEVGLQTCQELGMEFGKENLHFIRLGLLVIHCNVHTVTTSFKQESLIGRKRKVSYHSIS